MKFKYYITSLFNGCLRGTNDDELAKDLAESEDFFVVDAESGEWLHSNRSRQPVKDYASDMSE